ncbi:MAG: hypothetical protein Fur0037_04090 [Planctomycetota bacterium]
MGWSAAVLLVVCGALTAQDDAVAKARDAVAGWVSSDKTDEELLSKTVSAILDAGEEGIRWFGGRFAEDPDPASSGRKALTPIATKVCLEFVKRARASGMIYAGQYAPLASLMPYSGQLFLKLLFETPDWYPDNFRAQLVAPLRDLYPNSPGESELLGMVAIVEDERMEPQDLRRQLALALHQWGRPRFAQRELDYWRREAGDGDPSYRVYALRMLADIQYQLRSYEESARTYRLLEALARSSNVPLRPTDLYGSACSHALCGDSERAIAAFERCIDLQLSPSVDSSLHIEKKVFESDPDIRSIRGSGRFKAAMERAFGKNESPSGKDREHCISR